MRHLHRFVDTTRTRTERHGALMVTVPVRACDCGAER